MGLNKQALEFMLFEHTATQKIEGEYLSIGKQTVHCDEKKLLALYHAYQIDPARLERVFASGVIDTRTRAAGRSVFDHDLVPSFANVTYNCLDRSPYEGATIIHDMNRACPPELERRFDFIYDGSCMDNVFDPVTFLKNTSRLLATGGRIVHFEASSNVTGAYVMLSAEWFFSYYAINGFADCKVYVMVEREKGPSRFDYVTDLYEYKPYFSRDPSYSYFDAAASITGRMHVLAIAQKDKDSTFDKIPIQMQYLDDSSYDWRRTYFQFEESRRRKFMPVVDTRLTDLGATRRPFLSDHYTYIASAF